MSRDYDSIIEFENEHSGLDFKSVQYHKPQHVAFLKDIIAMANADVDGDRLIVIGVKDRPGEKREILPIEDGTFIDAANYQQLVSANVEPQLAIAYEPYQYKGQCVGMLRLLKCDDQPYMMKKKYGTLEVGECFVRKGSHQVRASREDMDRLYESRRKATQFEGSIDVGFWGTGLAQEVTVCTVQGIVLPSEKAADKIRQILAERRHLEKLSIAHRLLSASIPRVSVTPFRQHVPYEERSTETLEKNLADAEEAYRESDMYLLLEQAAFRLNFEIFNRADEYLLDATVQVELPKDDCCFVSECILKKPQSSWVPDLSAINLNIHYPAVECTGDSVRISQHVGDIRHQMRTKAFDEDVRLTLFRVPSSEVVPLTLTLLGKNLPVPIERTLHIKVTKGSPEENAQEDG